VSDAGGHVVVVTGTNLGSATSVKFVPVAGSITAKATSVDRDLPAVAPDR